MMSLFISFHLHAFEAELRKGPASAPYLYADTAQFCDIALFDAMDCLLSGPCLFTYDDVPTREFPRLRALLQAMKEDAAIADYLRERGDVISAIVKSI